MAHVIQAQGLSHRFGKIEAVSELDLQVVEGTVCAFLGPNGAGKTTTIRLLLGLIQPHAGTCEVLGNAPGHPKALAQLGAMVESPSLYDHLTGYENVEITRLMRNLPKSETDRVLTHVGLSRDARRVVLGYSMGMRQRLGLALAMLGAPKLMILDEPTNGLDPAGIQEIRDLIRRLPQETGATVFLSSHLLAEVELIAQQLVIIHRGRLRYQGALADFGKQELTGYRAFVDDLPKALVCLEQAGHTANIEGDHLRMTLSPADAPRALNQLVTQGLSVSEFAPVRINLEDRFLSLLEEK
jgi:ABC-type multidrug transport system ATPase subunit